MHAFESEAAFLCSHGREPKYKGPYGDLPKKKRAPREERPLAGLCLLMVEDEGKFRQDCGVLLLHG